MFLTNIAQFALGTVTFITTTASIIDALLSWVYGAILNSIRPKKWGRYRSWLILLPWLVPFLFAFQFLKIGDGPLSVAVIILGFVISHFVWNFPWVANVSMIAVAGKTPEDRAKLASTRSAWGNFSKVIFSYVGVPLASVFAGFLGERNQYAATAFVLALVMAVLYFAHFVMFDGYEEVDMSQNVNAAKDKTSGKDLIRSLIQNPPLIVLLLSDLAKWMFNFVVNGVAGYYFLYITGKGKTFLGFALELSLFIFISNIVNVLGGIAAQFIIKKLTARVTMIASFIFTAAFLLISNMVYTNSALVLILMSLAMFGYGVAYTCAPALYADTIIYAEWKTGKNATGWISGLQNIPLKVGVVFRGIVITACLALANFDASIDPAAATTELKKGICLAFMIIPAIALVVAALLLVVGFKITKEKVVQYQAEIAARNS